MKITNIPFGFPNNITLAVKPDDKIVLDESRQFNLKVILSIPEKDKKDFDENGYIQEIKKNNKNVNNVRIFYDIIKDSNVRSKVIMSARTNVDKIIEYGKVNNINITKSILDKLFLIGNKEEIKYTGCKSMQLLYASVRGSIGLKEGSGKEEVSVDFTQYPEGIISLCGHNGAGKSTFIENCHPYPRLLTRKGKLQDHFYLKDSHRKLIYRDDDGTYYEILIQIDGKNKTGKCKYFISSGTSLSELKPVEGIDGNMDPYSKWIDENFGPIDIFLRTAFIPKETVSGISDIAEAGKSEKKELFTSLVGIDRMTEISEVSKEEIKRITSELTKKEAMVRDIPENVSVDNYLTEIKGKMYDNETLEKEIKTVGGEIAAIENSISESEIKSKKQRISFLENDLSSIDEKIKGFNEYIDSKDDIEKHLMACVKLEEKVKQYDAWKKNVLIPAQEKSSILEKEIMKYEMNLKLFMKDHAHLQEQVFNIEDTCPTCGQKLPADKIEELNETLDFINKKIKASEVQITSLEKAIQCLRDQISDLNLEILNTEDERFNDELTSLKEEVSLMSDSDCENLIRFKDIDKEELHLSRSNTVKEIESLKGSLANVIVEEQKLRSLREKYDDIMRKNNNILTSIGILEEKMQKLKEDIKFNDSLSDEIKELKIDLEDYKTIQKAFGIDGIPALELEAMSPEIADLTNEILRSAYGDKFKVSFQTVRIDKDNKVIEDFSIMVQDTETCLERPLEWLSSGEAVWIKEALYNAFMIIRFKSTNCMFRTVFLDESDGSLDSAARLKYIKMIECAHKQCGVAQTIIITHSKELKDSITNRIDF